MARLEEFDDVQLDVEFTQASSRSNLTSNENIAISFGKISKWYEALVPTGGSSGQFLGFNSSGTAKWVSNPNVDEKVKSTEISQSAAAAAYYPTLMSGETTAGVGILDSAKINHTPGTTSVVGNTRLVLGNEINEGTTNNEQGLLRLWSSGTKHHTLKGAKITTDNIEHILPTTGGTILNTGTTSFTQTLSSGTKIGTIKINGTSSDIYAPTVNDAALTLKGAGTTVTTFTANASSAKSLDIVAGSNVTVTADATNAKISIASSHPTITKSTDTTSSASPGHGGTFTVVDSVTRETNGHVTKINTKTITLPADSNTDTKVTQSVSTTSNYRPVMLGHTNTTVVDDLATTVTNQVYATTNLFHKPSSGYLYSTAFSTAGYLTGAGAQLVTEGLYLKAYKVQADDSVLNYGRYAIRTYPGKTTVNPSSTAPNGAGMLVTVESGGLMIVGSGESAKNLADLISDDQSDANTSRTRLDVGGTLNTAFSGDTEQLILSSDTNIYFLTNCNTIADRTPVVLNTSSSFYPGTSGTGSIGTSSYRWNTAYINTIYENGTSLANKYAGISHTHTTTIAADSGSSQLTLSANTKYKLTAGDTEFIFTTPTDNDTKVTSSANHYTPSTVSGQDKSASASGATAAWSIDVVKGVTLNTDGKGHVTGISVTSGKIPANPVPSNNVTGSGTSAYLTKWDGTNTITNGPQLGSSTTTYLNNAGSWATPPDTKNTAGSTDTSSKIYLIGATSQATNPQTYSDNEVYTTSGVLTTKKVRVGGGSCTMEYNSTTETLDFVFA